MAHDMIDLPDGIKTVLIPAGELQEGDVLTDDEHVRPRQGFRVINLGFLGNMAKFNEGATEFDTRSLGDEVRIVDRAEPIVADHQ
ncbi:hypothetical protein LCD36_04550 [Saccharopolyspora sp. 6T]|uniref:hypothetical protein n=1 Tax=Saccharopolyspora sp. 6T TaxID=2877238 RepID=UPI001CD7BB4C|nr:hypothetical protein [Saccharopolyspora sp. 6T]MCA1185722.1 hypothetical protein [Saccharopolyspora sp. 6T]